MAETYEICDLDIIVLFATLDIYGTSIWRNPNKAELLTYIDIFYIIKVLGEETGKNIVFDPYLCKKDAYIPVLKIFKRWTDGYDNAVNEYNETKPFYKSLESTIKKYEGVYMDFNKAVDYTASYVTRGETIDDIQLRFLTHGAICRLSADLNCDSKIIRSAIEKITPRIKKEIFESNLKFCNETYPEIVNLIKWRKAKEIEKEKAEEKERSQNKSY